MLTASAVLREARARLTPTTWAQGSVALSDAALIGRRCCTAQAVERAYNHLATPAQRAAFRPTDEFPHAPAESRALDLILRALGRAVAPADRVWAVVAWQDEPGRTLDQVHAAIDLAIRIADPEDDEPC